jgi:hypothetical protein
MERAYTEPALVREYFSSSQQIHVVFDSEATVRAYACAPVFGEVFGLVRLLGHAAHLESGVMYLLVSEVVRRMLETKSAAGAPQWGMYDTYFGATPGLRLFKRRLGFLPHHVEWSWQSR